MKKIIRIFASCLLLGLLGVNAYAINVRVIGNGGGTLEMIALGQFDQLPEKIRLCTLAENPCHLDPFEISQLKQLRQSIESSPKDIILNFVDEPGSVYALDRARGQINIRAKAFYEVMDGFSGLEWLFIAYSDALGLDIENFKKMATTIMSTISYSRSDIYLNSVSSKLRFSSIESSQSFSYLDEVTDSGQLNNLSDILMSSLGCSGGGRIAKFGAPSLEGDGFLVDVAWLCGGELRQATVYGLKRSTAWSFQAFGAKEISNSLTLCSSLLKGPRKYFPRGS